jgi:L-asparaginase
MRVLIVGTGGSIAHVGRHPLDFVEYADGGRIVPASELVAKIPQVAAIADVVTAEFTAIASVDIGPKEWLGLNDAIHKLVAEHAPVDGIVVVHGTATLEETAYFLNLTSKLDQTIVVVGAQRPLGVLSTDADINLINAVRVAGDPAARNLGVLVVLNDEIQAAREVSKTSTYRLETFRSPDLGMLGYADPDGKVAIYRSPTRRHAPETVFDVRGKTSLPRVDIAYSYAGADATAIDGFIANGSRAIVIAALPPGRLPSTQENALFSAAQSGVLVVRSSRAGSGRVLPRKKFSDSGYVVADNLNPQKARILAMLALDQTSDRATIQEYFNEY